MIYNKNNEALISWLSQDVCEYGGSSIYQQYNECILNCSVYKLFLLMLEFDKQYRTFSVSGSYGRWVNAKVFRRFEIKEANINQGILYLFTPFGDNTYQF